MNNDITIEEMFQKHSTTIAALVAVFVGLDADRLDPASHEAVAILIKDGLLKINEDREIVRV